MPALIPSSTVRRLLGFLDRFLPWRRGRLHRTWLVSETRTARDTLATSLMELRQVMEQRFVALVEVQDAAHREHLGEIQALRDLLVSTMTGVQRALGERNCEGILPLMRDLKRDVAAQISFGAHDVAAQLGAYRLTLDQITDGLASALAQLDGCASAVSDMRAARDALDCSLPAMRRGVEEGLAGLAQAQEVTHRAGVAEGRAARDALASSLREMRVTAEERLAALALMQGVAHTTDTANLLKSSHDEIVALLRQLNDRLSAATDGVAGGDPAWPPGAKAESVGN